MLVVQIRPPCTTRALTSCSMLQTSATWARSGVSTTLAGRALPYVPSLLLHHISTDISISIHISPHTSMIGQCAFAHTPIDRSMYMQRAAWLPYFSDVHAILFLAPISAFDERLVEDRRVNRLEDTFLLWNSIAKSELLKGCILIRASFSLPSPSLPFFLSYIFTWVLEADDGWL